MTSTGMVTSSIFHSPLVDGEAIYESLAKCGDKRYDLTLPDQKTVEAARLSQGFQTEMISVDVDSGVPIWLQLRNRLIYLIASGKYLPGDKLPTVRELAVYLGVNYNTVSKVYQDIERDGYITSRRGKGTFVAERKEEQSKADLSEVDVLTDDYIRQCLELGVPLEEIASVVERRVLSEHS